MSGSIVINGRTVEKSNQQADAESSNYILVQTTGAPLNKTQKTELKGLGIEIQEFVGSGDDQIYLCQYKLKPLDEVRRLSYVEYADVYSQTFVVPETLSSTASEARGRNEDGTIDVSILLHQDVGSLSDHLAAKIAQAADIDPSTIVSAQGSARVQIDPARLESIAAIDEVRVIHPVQQPTLFNNIARIILHDDNVTVDGISYNGNGQIVCVADTGLDHGDKDDVLEAFQGRVVELFPWGRRATGETDDLDGHGTHVCGSVLGSGNHTTQGLVQGTAPGARLIVQSTFSGFDSMRRALLEGIPDDLTTLFDQAYKAKARIHTNSWGVPFVTRQNPYTNNAEGIDRFVWEHQDMTILFAAGNDGQDPDRDGRINEKSIGAQAAAKNCITVGASENRRPDLTSEGKPYTYGHFFGARYPTNPIKDDHLANNPEGLAAFSSRGPTAEGRLKPDVVAPGTAILSARSRNKRFTDRIKALGDSGDTRWMYLAGTSMATPLVAGGCAVLREVLLKDGWKDEDSGVKNPGGSLVKAILINGAVPITGQYVPDEVGDDPNPHSGFGRVDIAGSIVRLDDEFGGYGTGVIRDDEKPAVIEIPIPKGKPGKPDKDQVSLAEASELTLKATIVYADPPGAQLNNDLNLVVVADAKERHGNQFNRDFDLDSNQGFDRRNNVEQVIWPGFPAVDKVQLVVKPFRITRLDNNNTVPFAYAWKLF